MKQNPKGSTLRLLITTEQFTRLIDQVITEQQLGNNKKLIKSTTNVKKK
ncbi:MAG: hypothetical protein RL621_1164 [Bacteroidota bacterium]|jgi:hypothetical protein